MKLSPRRQRTKDLNKAVETLIEAHGGIAIRVNNQPRINPKNGKPYFPKGAPIGCSDWIGVMPKGITLFIEVKVSPDKMRDTQESFRAALRNRGHEYFVVEDYIDPLVVLMKGLKL